MSGKIKRVHFMGIRGSGIAGVARLASEMGYEVGGCDLEDAGHDVSHLEGVDLVVATPAVFYQSAKNPELLEAKKRKILLTWQQFLGEYLQKGKKTIAVCGTHGKSTTTAMAGKVLEDAGFDPTVVAGAKVASWGGSSRHGKGEHFVVEADEFYDNFLNYHPEIILLNNIEFDHPDYFRDEDHVFASYGKFMENLVGEKTLIVDPRALGIGRFLEKAGLRGVNVVKAEGIPGLNLKVFGGHNRQNASMVFALGRHLGIGEGVVRKSLEDFEGVGRRMELLGERRGVKVYDDYAHHPTAIKTTIEGLRKAYPQSRIWAVVEPHGYKRTKAVLEKYKGVFRDADRVIIGPVFKARDIETFGITPRSVAEKSAHPGALGVNTFEEIKEILKEELKEGDVVLVMGAGRSDVWARNLLGN